MGRLGFQQDGYMILELVEVDCLLNQNETANEDQIIEQSGGQGKGIVLSFVQERVIETGNVLHTAKLTLSARFCYTLSPMSSTEKIRHLHYILLVQDF